MSTIFKITIAIFLFFVLDTVAYSQSDSSKITFSEEAETQSDYKVRKSYQYLDIKKKDERFLIKISPKFQLIKKYGNLSLDFGVERKLFKEFSLHLYNSSLFTFDPYTDNVFTGNLSLEARYYPGLNKRVEKGISGNNLSGVYVGFGSSYLFEYSTDKLNNNDHTDYNIQRPYPYFVIGVQKRLNNWSFLEVYSIIGYTKDAYYYPEFKLQRLYSTLGFRLGFAWGK